MSYPPLKIYLFTLIRHGRWVNQITMCEVANSERGARRKIILRKGERLGPLTKYCTCEQTDPQGRNPHRWKDINHG